jgi:CubicO group peptidase (beta-lactamase class C family)
MVITSALPSSDEMAERLAQWAERYRVAGAAVAWMHGDETRSAATGVVNTETGVETTPDTLFQIGSITKVWTTSIIMQLVDEGKVRLDDPAVKYLPDLRFADEEETRRVTIRHLLTHTSGVDGDFFEDFGRGDDGVAKYVEGCTKLPFVFPVGTMWSYCNAGFVVLGRIIEVLTGKTWDEAFRDRLVRPLGLTHTVTLPEEALRYRVAAGHIVGLDREIKLAPRWDMPRSSGPAGATPCSSVADLLTFAKMHLDGGVAAGGARLLSEAAVAEMQRPHADLPPHPGDFAHHWGLGWMLFDWDGRRVIGHDGGTIGQNSSLRILPDERFAVAVLTNTTPTGTLMASRIMRWLFGYAGIELPPYPKPPETPPAIDLAPYAGVYEKNEARTEIAVDGEQLAATIVNTGPLASSAPQQPPMRLYPVDASLFLQQMPGTNVFQPVSFLQFVDGRPTYFFASRLSRRIG